MGVSYIQYAILGIKINKEDIKKVLSEAVYELQPRYDTKTGKEIGKERVLVKEKEEVYEFKGVKNSYFYELEYDLEKGFPDLDVLTTGGYNDEECIYIGKSLKMNSNDYTFDGMDGEISVKKIMELEKEVSRILDEEVQLYFWTYCG